jgi:transcription initiation factor TFIID TATA-box-binding protein
MLKLEIVNVVATADMHQQVDLIQISQLEYTIHDQEVYGGRVAYLKTPEMHGKVTIFPSGKLISVGTRSPDSAQLDLVETVDILVSKGLIDPVSVLAEIRNIVAVQHLENLLDLESLALVIGGIYEPEQFPGLILRNDEPKVTYLIFSSGKVVLAGSKSIQELGQAAENLKTIIQAAEALLS